MSASYATKTSRHNCPTSRPYRKKADKLIADKLIADKLIADKLIADKLIADKLIADG
jgi:hypothetical protein